MISGTYSIILSTPMGAKRGELSLELTDGALTGVMHILGRRTALASGRYDGGRFGFSGRLETAVGPLAYDCTGRVDGDRLSAVARTGKGDFKITGARKS